MKDNGTVASIGLAQSPEIHTWVMPSSCAASVCSASIPGELPPEVRETVWRRLAGDMKPALLGEMARTIAFAELPKVFEDFINAKVTRRVVVDLEE